MEITTNLITDNQQYLLLLATVMGLSFWAKKTQIFLPVYKFIADRVKSKRAVVALISLISGVLPVNGRASISAGALDTVAPNNEKRKVFGIIDYLSTHHYYFWSPLEATVILPMAALSISYGQFMGRIWPLLATALIVIFYYIFKVVKEDEVEINIKKSLTPTTWKEDRKQIKSYATTLLFVGFVIGEGVTLYKLRHFIMEAAKDHGITIIDDEESEDKLIHDIKLHTEKINDMLYLYTHADHNFICQAKTLDELAILSKEYKNITKAVVVHEESEIMFIDGLVKQHSK